MAGELQVASTTGQTIYVNILNHTGQFWNTSGTPAFEAFNGANFTDYDVALVEQSTTGIYLGDFPSTIPQGTYKIIPRIQAGGSPAVGDLNLPDFDLGWSGTVTVPQAQLANDVPHGGPPGSSTATLALARAVLQASGNDTALYISGAGYGAGIDVWGGDNFGEGARFSGNNGSGGEAVLGSSDGNAIYLQGSGAGSGLSVTTSGNGPVIGVLQGGSGGGLSIVCGASSTQPAVHINSAGSGPGMQIDAAGSSSIALNPTDFPGLVIQPQLSSNPGAAGISILGAGTGAAVQLGDGVAGAEGIKILAGTGNTNSAGILALGAGNLAAVQLGDDSTAARGLDVRGANGNEAASFRSTTGDGVLIDGAGTALFLNSSGTGPADAGLRVDTAKDGIHVSSGQHGLLIDAAGDGIQLNPAGNGITMLAGTNGIDIQASALGINVVAGGNNPGLSIVGSGSAAAVQWGDGSTGGEGLNIQGASGSSAVTIGGGDNASGMEIAGGLESPALVLSGGAGTGSAAPGLRVQAGAADSAGLLITGVGTGPALRAVAASGGNANAIEGVGDGSGAGFSSVPDAVGFGGGSGTVDANIVSVNTTTFVGARVPATLGPRIQ